MKFYTNQIECSAELLDVVKLFFDDVVLISDVLENDGECVIHESRMAEGIVENVCRFEGYEYKNEHKKAYKTVLEEKKMKKRYAKLAVYYCLKQKFGQRPWGALTGIRPTRFAYDLVEKEGVDYRQAMRDMFDVSPKKIQLVDEILSMQRGLIESSDNEVDIYIGIPFCVSKCIYCSFPSGLKDKLKKYVQPYTDCLTQEIIGALEIVDMYNYKLKNVYFGGGTPTSLSAEQLYKLMSVFKGREIEEFTVEAGRPDTVDGEKLACMKECGVTRVSVNPQTFNAEILDRINRKHSPKDIVRAYREAKALGFAVNMDLIAGLPGETEEMFAYSVNSCLDLGAENITVHTLALKRGSELWESAAKKDNEKGVENMVDYASDALHKNGYKAYYMYRQKYVKGNLENVGYCKEGEQCRYNIDMMEERRNVIACGANAISKRVWKEQSRIERYAETKDVALYIERVEGVVKDKKNFFKP